MEARVAERLVAAEAEVAVMQGRVAQWWVVIVMAGATWVVVMTVACGRRVLRLRGG